MVPETHGGSMYNTQGRPCSVWEMIRMYLGALFIN